MVATVLCLLSFGLATERGEAAVAWGTTGILYGRVHDSETNVSLPGVNIIIAGTTIGSVTDSSGEFQINYLSAGEHEVRFSLIGYSTVVVKHVIILPDRRNRLDVRMNQSAVELGVVEITSQKPLIQKDHAATSYSISRQKIEDLPISSFKDIVGLQPGTTLEGNIRGGRINEVIYLIDGLPAQDLISGGLGSSVPRSSITGLTIYTGGFEAEYGNALSGVINVVTKSGTDAHTLETRVERDKFLPNSITSQHSNKTEAELTLSGPLVRGKLTYFSANSLTLSDSRWWQDFNRYFSSPIDREFAGISKLEYDISPRLRLDAQAIYSVRRWHDYEFSWRYNLTGLPDRSRSSARTTVSLSHILSNTAHYQVTLSRQSQVSKIGDDRFTNVIEPYEYDFFLRYIVRGTRHWRAINDQTTWTMKGEFTTHLRRMHMVKAGADIHFHTIASDILKFEPQLTYFGKPIPDAPMLNFSTSYAYKPGSGSVFVQDRVQFDRDGSTFSAGLRWDFLDPTADRPIVEFIPVRENEFRQQVIGRAKASFKHQISPRLSFSAPAGASTFFFVNFGHYFQFPLFEYLYSGINPVSLREGSRNVLTGNPDLEPERTVAWEIGFKRAINDRMVGSFTYFQKTTANQLDTKTLVPFDSKSAGDFGFASYVNNSEARATGVEFVLTRERDTWLNGTISYSLMYTEGISEYADQRLNFAQWGFPLHPKKFPLSWDQRHTAKIDAEVTALWGIRGNVNILYHSPRPYTYFPTRDGYTPLDSSKAFLPNNRRMDHVIIVNMKVMREFERVWIGKSRVVLYADIRNLFDTRNIRWIDSNGRIGGELDDPGAFHEPRRMKLGARIEW